MPGAEFSNLKGEWSSGELHIKNAENVDVMVIGGTTGLRSLPAGNILSVTTAATLTLAYSGRVVTCSVDATIITLPAIASTTMGVNYTIVNTAPPGTCEIKVLAGATSNVFVGGGWSSTSLSYQLTNSKATASPGDSVKIASLADPVNTVMWSVMGLVGTWVSTT